jgi:hypothetical protein
MSLFKRPAWATSTNDQGDNDTTGDSLFRHSDRTYSAIVAEEQRRKKERAERDKVKEERRERRSSEKRIKSEDDKADAKRRRITQEEGANLLGEVGLNPVVIHDQSDEAESGAEDDEDAMRRQSPRLNKKASREVPPKRHTRQHAATVVELGDSEDDEPRLPIRPVQPVEEESPEEEEEEEESDPELAELTRQARAQRRLKEEAAKKSQTPDMKSPTPGQERASAGTGLPTPPPPDPPVKLFITSPIPGTKPLLVYRKLSQRLQEARKAWVDKQGFTKEMQGQVFLIHRMRRVYDVTTCRSLGLQVSADGETTTMKGAEGIDDVDRVHLEAVTEEHFEKMKAEKLRKERERNGEVVDGEEDAAGGASEPAAPAPVDETVRITLKAKGHQDFKLSVKKVWHIVIPPASFVDSY